MPERKASAEVSAVETEDRLAKASDLERAKGNGGVSPDRLIVVYGVSVMPTDTRRNAVRQRVNGQLLRSVGPLQRDVLRVPPGQARIAAREARAMAGVQDAYPDTVVYKLVEPGDPLRTSQWGIDYIHAPAAWASSDGAGVRVAILDCGIRASHPDLIGALVFDANFSASPTTDDLCNHGTPSAGVVLARAGNGVGITGIAPRAQLVNVKVLDDAGSGFLSDIDDGIIWAATAWAPVVVGRA